MSRKKLGRNAKPYRLSSSLHCLGSRRLDDGQFEFEAIGQYFAPKINDWGFTFAPGCFAKTLEGVAAGRVKINDYHRWDSRSALGSVVEARETDEGLWYRGRISSAEPTIATKIEEGHLNQNSVEIYLLRDEIIQVDRSRLPIGGFHLGERPDGKVEIRRLLEVQWLGIALTTRSSQDEPAVLDTSARPVPFGDLRTSSSPKDPDPEEVRQRLLQFASERGGVNLAKIEPAFLLMGQGADDAFRLPIADVVNGQLTVMPALLERAMEELQRSEFQPGVVSLASATVGRYLEKQGRRRPRQALCGSRLGAALNDMLDEEEDRDGKIEEMANEAAIERGTVLQILRGDIDCPPVERLEAFAAVLDVPVSTLVAAAEEDGCTYNLEKQNKSGHPKDGLLSSVSKDSTPAGSSPPAAATASAAGGEAADTHGHTQNAILQDLELELIEAELALATRRVGSMRPEVTQDEPARSGHQLPRGGDPTSRRGSSGLPSAQSQA